MASLRILFFKTRKFSIVEQSKRHLKTLKKKDILDKSYVEMHAFYYFPPGSSWSRNLHFIQKMDPLQLHPEPTRRRRPLKLSRALCVVEIALPPPRPWLSSRGSCGSWGFFSGSIINEQSCVLHSLFA